MSDDGELDLNTLNDEDLVLQVVSHSELYANIARALESASTNTSTSSAVLYNAKLARAVALTPKWDIKGWAQ